MSVWACSIGHCAGGLVWHRVQSGAACPASGRGVGWGVPGALVCAAVLGLDAGGGHRRGIGPKAGGGVGEWSDRRQGQKGVPSYLPPSFLYKSPPPLLPVRKISRKNKKTPTKGLCSVLYLPYNLEREESVKWLKAK